MACMLSGSLASSLFVAVLWAAGRSGLRDWEWSWDWEWSLAHNHWRTAFYQKWHECALGGYSCHSWTLWWLPTLWLLEFFLVESPVSLHIKTQPHYFLELPKIKSHSYSQLSSGLAHTFSIVWWPAAKIFDVMKLSLLPESIKDTAVLNF